MRRFNQVAEGWKTRRMGKVELTILRLAVYEMQYDEEIPEKVAINEAVELAKKFGRRRVPGIYQRRAGETGSIKNIRQIDASDAAICLEYDYGWKYLFRCTGEFLY